MNFKLNDFDKVKDEETGKRSKRTIEKEKLYKVINKNIRDIRNYFDKTLTKNGKQKEKIK